MSKRFLRASLFFVLLIILWEWLVALEVVPSYLIPPPSMIFEFFISAVKDGTILSATLVTFQRLLSGYFIGILLGIPIGLLSARFDIVRDTIGTLSLGLQTLPSVCWIPLALLWFGQSETALLFIVVMGTIWSVILATESGIRGVPPIFIKAARTMGSSGMHTIIFVAIPAALPSIVAGMKQGWAFAWRSLMAAEIYVTVLTGFGLGHLLHYGRELLAMDQVMAVMFIIMFSGYLVDRLMFSPIEQALRRRWGISS